MQALVTQNQALKQKLEKVERENRELRQPLALIFPVPTRCNSWCLNSTQHGLGLVGWGRWFLLNNMHCVAGG
jgi:hypothetical protein